jgi:hypothetical protein
MFYTNTIAAIMIAMAYAVRCATSKYKNMVFGLKLFEAVV